MALSSKHSIIETNSSPSTVAIICGGTETTDDISIHSTPSKKQKKIHYYFISPPDNYSMDAILAWMTSLDGVDGLSFRVFITSVALRLGLDVRGFKDTPKSVTSIRNRILAYPQKMLNYYVLQFQTIKKNGGYLSLTLEELNISLDNDVVCVTNDGASVMKKFVCVSHTPFI